MGSHPPGHDRGLSARRPGRARKLNSAAAVSRRVGVAGALACAFATAVGCGKPIAFDPAAIAKHRMLEGAPRGFLLGAATSAYQIEGGNHNDWTDWEKGAYPDGSPHVADGATATRAADSWNYWRADLSELQ